MSWDYCRENYRDYVSGEEVEHDIRLIDDLLFLRQIMPISQKMLRHRRHRQGRQPA